MTFDLGIYLQGYLAVTLPISWIVFICGTNTTHEGTMCHISFLCQKVNVTQVVQIFALWGRGERDYA